MESPSKSSITYKDLRLAGYSGTKYDAEMLISQGLADGICPPQPLQPQPAAMVVTARSPTTVNTSLAAAVIKDLPSSAKRGAAPPRQPPPVPPPPPPQVREINKIVDVNKLFFSEMNITCTSGSLYRN